MISQHYRTSYTGEDVVVERTIDKGAWKTVCDYVPNQVTNDAGTGVAVIIGNGTSRESFSLSHLVKPQIQTYGCNALYRDFSPNFLITTNKIASEMVSTGFTIENIVYSDLSTLLEYPQQFYLIPHNPYLDCGTTAAYLAAFDGHTRIYMIGFDGQDTPGFNYNVYSNTVGYDNKDATVSDEKWIENRRALFFAYPEVDFVWVTPNGKHDIPERLKHCHNHRQLSHRGLVLECDL